MPAIKFLKLGSAAALAALPLAQPAHAQTASNGEIGQLQSRVDELEAALKALRAELAARQPVAAPAPVAIATTAPPPSASAGGGTTVKLSGFVKLDVIANRFSRGESALNAAGRDFYLPSTIPVGTGAAGKVDLDTHVKQTRLVFNSTTPLGKQVLATHIEADFQTSPGTQATERTTNGVNLALRRAFISYGDFTIGQDWSNFAHLPFMPETTDLIGPTEGSVFIRQPQIRWRKALSKQLTLFASLENPETASATPQSSALIENRDDSLPDATVKLVLNIPFGEFSVGAIGRRLTADGTGFTANATAWGVSAGGKIPFGKGGRNDLRFFATAGEGIGRYVGVNFAPDAILVPQGTGFELEQVRIQSAFVAARWFWATGLRSTASFAIQNIDTPAAIAAADLNAQAWSAAFNLFYSPAEGFDLGLEYRHGAREVASGLRGSLDRVHFIVKRIF